MSSNDLAQYLDSISRQDRYRADATLKRSDAECTEVVYLQEPSGITLGPYVRKTIKRGLGIGSAYERIFAQQQTGQVFSYIPRLRECYTTESDLVVVMEFVHGQTLQDLIYQSDPSVDLARAIFPQICDAVSELHERFDPPIIHRDLKPSNVMISNGRVYIIDLGIAREFKDEVQSDTTHFGTRAYAPPEQYGFGQTTVRSDVYALGMLLYYCLTEKTPDAQIAQDGFNDPLIPYPLRTVLKRATAFDPQARYASVRDLKTAVESAFAGKPDPIAEEQMNQLTKAPSIITIQPKEKKSSRIGIVYNIFLGLAVALVLSVNYMLLFGVMETKQTVESPAWLNAFGYAFFIPIITLATALLIMYKRPLKNRFPRIFGQLEPWQYIVGYLIIWAVFIIILGVLSTIAKQ